MEHYIKGVLDEAPNDMNRVPNTPDSTQLFQVNPSALNLSRQTAELFHHLVAMLLFLCKQACPNILSAVVFLTMWVQAPNNDNYKKLSMVIKYLHGTTPLCLILEASNLSIAKWWVDGAYASHPDMKSHMGRTLSLGKGMIYSKST